MRGANTKTVSYSVAMSNDGTLGADITAFITSRSILLIMRNVSDKSYRGNQNTNFVLSNFFFKSYCL